MSAATQGSKESFVEAETSDGSASTSSLELEVTESHLKSLPCQPVM